MTEQNKSKAGPIALVVAIIVVIAAGGAYFMMGRDNAGTGTETSMNEMAPAADSAETAANDNEEGAEAAETAAANGLDIQQGNPTVAIVDGEEIKRNEVLTFIVNLPEQIRQMPVDQLFPMALEQVINNKVVVDKAQTANLENDPEVEEMLTEARTQIIRNVYVDRQVSERITEDKLRARYDELVARMGDIEEIKARHILVETEEKANELIAELEEGADFVELAEANSTGPSAANGGDLGYFAQNEMVPEFSEAAFAIEPGNFGKEPVQTQFGYHVIMVEEKRNRPAPAFELVKPQLEAQVRQEELAAMLEDWKEQANVEKFDINGEPVDENAAPAAEEAAPEETEAN